MRAVLLFGLLLASANALVPVQKGYHDTVGVPLARQIKAYEEGLMQNRVIGGALAPEGGQPWFAGLLISLLNTSAQSVCGSSLIGPARLITAAHCWFDGVRQAFSINAIMNSVYLFGGSGTRVNSNHVVMHPQYTPSNLNNDVAIIYLPFSVISPGIAPISIPTASEAWETFEGSWAVATGFGRTHDQQVGASTQLSRVTLRVISVQQCRWVWGPSVVIESTLCTDGAGSIGICNGDSGGPLTVFHGDRPVLIGVSSFVATNGCQLGFPSGFARVTSFRNFILQHM